MVDTIKFTNDPNDMSELYIAAGYYYLAHAYINDDPAIQNANATHALWVYGNLFVRGVICYNPIEATIRAAHAFNWAHNFEPYKILNERFIDQSSGVLVVMSDGWEKSRGVSAEINYAIDNHIPVWYLDCEEFDIANEYGKPQEVPT
jgi:hypothetical protein